MVSKSINDPPSSIMAINSPHQQGINNSHVPIGLSRRESLKKGLDHSGQ